MKALLKITNKVEEQYQDSVTVQVVRKLISFSRSCGDLPQFVNAAYTDKIYRGRASLAAAPCRRPPAPSPCSLSVLFPGQTALHIAVERRRCDLVRLLMQSGATVDPMAKGSFFRNKRHKQCSFYFGGWGPGRAACTGWCTHTCARTGHSWWHPKIIEQSMIFGGTRTVVGTRHQLHTGACTLRWGARW